MASTTAPAAFGAVSKRRLVPQDVARAEEAVLLFDEADSFFYARHGVAAGPGSLPILEKSLSDEDEFVRHAAVKALRSLETPEAIARLLLATADPYELVRNEAEDCLLDIGLGRVEKAIATLPDADELRAKAEELFRQAE